MSRNRNRTPKVEKLEKVFMIFRLSRKTFETFAHPSLPTNCHTTFSGGQLKPLLFSRAQQLLNIFKNEEKREGEPQKRDPSFAAMETAVAACKAAAEQTNNKLLDTEKLKALKGINNL